MSLCSVDVSSVPRGFASALLGGVLVLAGCSAKAPPQALEELRAQLVEAKADPDINRLAPGALTQATDAFVTADALGNSGGDAEQLDHELYLAGQRLELARVRTSERLAEERMRAAVAERDRLESQAQLRDAERVKAEAEAMMRQATAVRLAAERSAEVDRLARAEAERSAQRAMEERDLALEAAARDRALAAELAELNAQATERGLVLTLGDVLFDLNEAELKAGTKVNLERLVEFLLEHDDRNVLIEGHTDSTGSVEYNTQLSEARATAVSDELVEQGIDTARIAYRGLGPYYPLVSNDTAEGRQRNRRVEIIILHEGQDAEGQLREATPE